MKPFGTTGSTIVALIATVLLLTGPAFVSIQQRYVADFALKPSNLAETVNITGDAVPLQTSEASLGASSGRGPSTIFR